MMKNAGAQYLTLSIAFLLLAFGLGTFGSAAQSDTIGSVVQVEFDPPEGILPGDAQATLEPGAKIRIQASGTAAADAAVTLIQYSFDGMNWASYRREIPIPQGAREIHYRAYDRYENESKGTVQIPQRKSKDLSPSPQDEAEAIRITTLANLKAERGDWNKTKHGRELSAPGGWALAIEPGPSRTDFRIETTFASRKDLETSAPEQNAYVIFGYEDAENYYYAGAEMNENRWVIKRLRNGKAFLVASKNHIFEDDKPYRLAVSIEDGILSLEAGSELKLSFTFNPPPEGKTGLGVYRAKTVFTDQR